MITIYDINGNPKISVPITDKSVYYKGVSEEEYINLSFNHHELLQLANGDYIICEHGRFEIVKLSLPDDKNASDGGFAFEQRFNPHWWRASLFKLFYNRQAGKEASWKMTHYAYYFMDIVVDNLRRAGIGEYTYEVDASLTEMKLVSFDGVDIISGLTLIAEAFESEWWFADNVIHLSRCEYGEPVQLGTDEVKISREDSADTEYATRLYLFGATRNLPQNYRRDESTDLVVEGVVERRLKLPEGIDHIDAWENLAHEDVVEAIISTDEIYPRRTGTIATITTKQYTDTIENEDGTTSETKWNAFRFTDAGITFSKEYIIAGEELRIIFQSGKLVGLDFAVTFNPDGLSEEKPEAQIWEIVRNEDYGVKLPADNFAPEPGDTYILYGYDTSFVADYLLPDAEQELLEFGKEKIKKLSQDKSNYNCTTNPVRCAGYTMAADGSMQYNEADVIDLDVGSMVELSHPVYFPDASHVGRVRSFEKHLDNRYNCTYSVGEAKGYSRSGQLAEQVQALTYQSRQYFISGGAGSNVYLIKRQDPTAPSEHNTYSAVRARIEFLCRSVAERVRTHWSFLKGISVGAFASGASGAQIDADGNAEFKSLTARNDANIGGNLSVKGNTTAKQLTANDNMVAPRFSTPDFRAGGLSGEGAGIYTDDSGLTYAEFDHIIARRGLSLSTLTIEEVRSVGGGVVASKGEGEVEKVGTYYGNNGDLRYIIYLKDVNKFVVNDLVRYARYDHTNNSYRWAWAPVRGCDNTKHYINLWASDFVDGMTAPQPGDRLVQMGHTSDPARQGFVYIIPEGVHCFDGVNSPSLVGKCRGVLGDLSDITDDGKALSGYGLWTDKLYIGTGKTVYETFAELYNSIATTDSVLASYQTEVNSHFDVVDGALSSVQKSVTSLQTGGGRNLLLKTNQGVTGWNCITDSDTKPFISSDTNAVTFDYIQGNASAAYELYTYDLRPEVIVEGRSYTIAVDVKSLMGTGIILQLQIANNIGSSPLIPNTYADKALVDEQWVRISFSFIATATGSESQRVRFSLPTQNLSSINCISFRNLKLEEGEVATAYSPAPEDYVDTELSDVLSSITDIEQTTNSISARVEEVNTSLNGKISSNTTKITQNSSAITSEVTARTDADAQLSSRIDQTAQSISLKLSEVALSNINHAIGTELPIIKTSGFSNSQNATVRLYDVTGLTSGDKVCISLICRFRNLVWGNNAFISFQLSGAFGWIGWNLRLTEQFLSDNNLSPDEDGYYNIRVHGTGAVVGNNFSTGTETIPSDVGWVYARMDYIAAGDDAYFEVSQLKIETGDTITAWTARTGDLDEALADTGIDISHRLIKATADNFKILNNLGAVTMEVDADGNLTANAVLVRNLDSATAQYTPYLTTINLANGYIQLYYPLDHDNGNDNLSLQIGWDESSESVFRFFGKDGAMAWKAGSQAALIDTALSTETTITPVDLYKCLGTSFSAASAEIKTTASLPASRLYKKVVQAAGTTTTTYHADAACTSPANGYFTDIGLPQLAFASDSDNSKTYSRRLYYISNGAMETRFVTWNVANDFIIT